MKGITFNPERHEYTLNGRRVPSVTEVIQSVLPGYQAEPWYLQRGQALHLACRYLDEGRLDRSSVSPEIEGRVMAWERFRRELPSENVAIEEYLGDELHGFAGTLDRVLMVKGELCLVDIKSSHAPQTIIQLGGYQRLWWHNKNRSIAQAAEVVLNEDGTYRATWLNKYEMNRGERVFLACLSVHNFKCEYME